MLTAVELIKDRINANTLQNVLDYYRTPKVHIHNSSLRACCPIHGGDNPTAFVWKEESGLWYCHTGCQTGGDIFDFVARMEGLETERNFKRIVYLTAELMGLNITDMELGERSKEHVKEMRNWLRYMMDKEKVKINPPFDLSKLGENIDAIDFRGLGKEVVEHFDIKINKTFNRFLVPIKDKSGIIVGATMRAIDDHKIKWLHKPDNIKTNYILYNMDKVVGDTCKIVEGASDVINLYYIGVEDAVAQFGTSLGEEQVDLVLERYVDVYLLGDGDRAGRIGVLKNIEKLYKKTNLMVYDLPDGVDPGDLTKEQFDELTPIHPYIYVQKYSDLAKELKILR